MNSKILGLVAVALLAGPMQVAQSTTLAGASGWLQMRGVEIYTINQTAGIAASYSFVNANEQLRALTGVNVGDPCIYDTGCSQGQQQSSAYTNPPTLPVTSSALNNSDGSAYGRVTTVNDGDDSRLEAGCHVDAANRGCNGGAGVSTTASNTLLNLILGPNTGIRMLADSFVSLSLLDFCNITCNRAYIDANLLVDFGGGSRQFARNQLEVDAKNLPSPHNGNLITDQRNKELSLGFENTSLTDSRTGRIRWFIEAYAASTVPEPGTFALLGLGLVGLGLSRRRRAA